MKLVIFGLTVSSSWGNGHATLWRGLCSALGRRGHSVVFFERDVPYYSATRDLFELPGGGQLVLYEDWSGVLSLARRELAEADVALVTSYCPDGLEATEAVLDSGVALRTFYDLDTPVTLARLDAGETVDYIGPRGLSDFDLVLSYTGGRSLERLRKRLNARRVAPLYGSVDPEVHRPEPANSQYRGDLGYIGTYAKDREQALSALFVEPAKRLPERKFVLAGSMYDRSFQWRNNIYFVSHLPPALHSSFYCSTNLTLNVTRSAMARAGWCPSGRLFEAAACGAPLLSDRWEGIDQFFSPGSEILLADTTEDAIAALEKSPGELARIAVAARERTLAENTAKIRVGQLEDIFSAALHSPAAAAMGDCA